MLTWIWNEIPELTLDVGEYVGVEMVGILYLFNVILQIGVEINLLSEFQGQIFDDLLRFLMRSSIKRMLFYFSYSNFQQIKSTKTHISSCRSVHELGRACLSFLMGPSFRKEDFFFAFSVISFKFSLYDRTYVTNLIPPCVKWPPSKVDARCLGLQVLLGVLLDLNMILVF